VVPASLLVGAHLISRPPSLRNNSIFDFGEILLNDRQSIAVATEIHAVVRQCLLKCPLAKTARSFQPEELPFALMGALWGTVGCRYRFSQYRQPLDARALWDPHLDSGTALTVPRCAQEGF